ncbi:MAG TPA: hypothetical protein VF240_12010, partial [Pyrinomonadaceae bacterium]
MRLAHPSLSSFTRRLAVVAFGLWLGGAGCAFCCASAENPARVQDATSSAGAQADSTIFAPTHCPAHARASAGTTDGFERDATSVQTPSPTDNHASSCCGKSRQPS